VLLAILLTVFPVQDDFSKWIVQLESESISEREEATRRLQALGEAALDRLEKARDGARDPEVKARLEALIVRIRKVAELAKVLGPTKRMTIAARGRPLKEILAQLAAPGVAGVDAGLLDPEARLDLQVRDATWWEALDRTARAAGARYDIQDNEDGRVKIVLVRGKEPEGPVVYAEQFRISVAEAKRYEFRAPATRSLIAMIVVEVRHQPDLKPGGRTHDEAIRFDSVTDAKGDDAKALPPGWAGSSFLNPRCLGLQEKVWVRPDAALPLTITGRSDVAFPSETREVTLDLSGDGSKFRAGKATLQAAAFTSSKDAARLTLTVDAEELPDVSGRLVESSVFIVDSKGKRHPGMSRSGGGSDDHYSWKYEFTSGIEEPRKLVLKWVEEFYRVEIPFRLEGVRLPDLK